MAMADTFPDEELAWLLRFESLKKSTATCLRYRALRGIGRITWNSKGDRTSNWSLREGHLWSGKKRTQEERGSLRTHGCRHCPCKSDMQISSSRNAALNCCTSHCLRCQGVTALSTSSNSN